MQTAGGSTWGLCQTSQTILAFCGFILVAWAFWGKYATCARPVAYFLAGVTAINAINFIILSQSGAITTAESIPFSVYVAIFLLFIATAGPGRSHSKIIEKYRNALTWSRLPGQVDKSDLRCPRRKIFVSAIVVIAITIMFPLGQMRHFGETDYRRPSDAIVVFGAGVYPDGSPSDALSDRVLTACKLYNQGLADKLIVSGGPGMGSTHETSAMRDLAISAGVPESDIIIDPHGLSTQETVVNTVAMAKRLGFKKILAVSHDYHLPRIKMCYQRSGMEVYTVPATQAWPLRQKPYFMAREVAAFWVYYLRPLAG